MLIFAICLAVAVVATAMAVRALSRPRAYRAIVEGIDAIAFEYSPKRDTVKYLAPQVSQLLGSDTPRIHREFMRDVIHPDDRKRVRAAVRAYADGATTGRIEYRLLRDDGGIVQVRTLLGERDGGVVRGITIDATKQTRIEAERREAHKLESVGRLAAGVAHEINTPAQYTADSLQFVKESIAELAAAIERHPEARAVLAADESADLEYVLANVPAALDRAADGLDRISTIVGSLRELGQPSIEERRVTIDLGDVLGDALAAARIEYDEICEIATDLPELPRIHGNRSELRRVFLNILGNAARAVADTKRRGTIAITTRRDGEQVKIMIADTGTGIPLEVRHLVFEPFFTTREPGKARGQGLAVSRAVIARHDGTLGFDTEVGKGTTFTIRLPIAASVKPKAVAA